MLLSSWLELSPRAQRLAIVVMSWVRNPRLRPEQFLADRLQLLFSRQAGFQGGFDIALLAGRSDYVQVAIHIVDRWIGSTELTIVPPRTQY
jgi:hypothetical protein